VIASNGLFWKRVTVAGVLAAVASLVPVGAAHAATCGSTPSPCVVVHLVGAGTPQTTTFSIADVTAHATQHNGGQWPFVLRNDQGGGGTDPCPTAWPVGDLLGFAGIDPQQLSYVEVPSHAPSVLTPDELASDGHDFLNNLVPAICPVNGDALTYIRPLRSNTDVNSDESVLDADGAIVVNAYQDKPPLQVSLQAPASTSVAADQAVTFTASVSRSGAPVVGPVDYQWDFISARPRDPGAGDSVTRGYAWTSPGTYYVSVSAHDVGSDTYGRSLPVLMQVGPKPPPTGQPHHPGTGRRHPGHHHPATGPTDGGGHQTHGHGTNSSSQGGANTGSSSPRTSTGTPQSTRRTGSPRHSVAGPTPHRTQTRPAARGGVVVAGQVLDGAQPFAAPQPNKEVQAIEPAQTRPREHWSMPWKLASVLVVPLLVGIGMAGEAATLRRRVTRMSA
jgi:hypothetical protein